MLNMNLTSQSTGEGSKIKKNNGMTLNELKNTLDTEHLSIMVQKISSHIYINPPKTIWHLEVAQLFFENMGEKLGPIMIFATDPQDVIEIFSIQKIHFKSSKKSDGYIQGVSLKIGVNQGRIQLLIEKICKESPNNPNKPIIEIPTSTIDKSKKQSKSTNTSQKAFELQFVFEDNKLANVQILLSQLSMFIDYPDICEEFASLSMFNQMLSYQRSQIPIRLSESVFEKEIFEKTQNDLLKKKKQLALSKKSNPPALKFGPFMVHSSFALLIQLEKFGLHLVKDKIVIFTFD